MKDSLKPKSPLKLEEKMQARIQQGLLPTPVALLSLDRFSNCTTKSQLDQFRKYANCQPQLNIITSTHKDAEARLKEREKLLTFTPPPGKTYQDIKISKTKQDTDYLTKTFGNQRLGIHGEELPKFHKNIEIFCKENRFRQESNGSSNTSNTDKFIKKHNFDISDPPNKLKFSPENYRTKSQYLRVRDKNVGAIRRSKYLKNLGNQLDIFKNQQKTVVLFSNKKRSGRSIRSRGFVI